jgi:hypothetical protein
MDAVYTDNHIEGIIQIKIVMAVEITSDKLVNLALAGRMRIMELVHGLELDDIQAIWQDAIWFSLQQMLRLVCNDVGDSGKNVCIMCRGTLNAVVVVNTVFSSLVVDVKVLEVVVEIDASGAEVSAEESCVSSKDGCDVDVTFATERNGKASLPFVKVCYDSELKLARDVLKGVSVAEWGTKTTTNITEEPCDEITKDN